mgnify:CR=1 FL=1
MADLTAREALDVFRTMQGKFLRPLERLPQALETAIQIIEHDLPAAKREWESLTGLIQTLREDTPKVQAAQAEAKQRMTNVQRQANEAEAAAQIRIQEAEGRAKQREAALDQQYDDKQVAHEAKYNAAAAMLGDEIRSLEETRDRLQQEVTGLRNKFAAF